MVSIFMDTKKKKVSSYAQRVAQAYSNLRAWSDLFAFAGIAMAGGIWRTVTAVLLDGPDTRKTLNRYPDMQPTPYTLHPTPYTLHPTPYTLIQSAERLPSEGKLWCTLRLPRAPHPLQEEAHQCIPKIPKKKTLKPEP
jgi:hypothetical protein